MESQLKRTRTYESVSKKEGKCGGAGLDRMKDKRLLDCNVRLRRRRKAREENGPKKLWIERDPLGEAPSASEKKPN